MIQRVTLTCVALLIFAGCGYFSSGKWEDDPQNWERAWGYGKPESVMMPHSWYWRSPHWTREEAYFFEFRWHQDLFKQLVVNNDMTRAESAGSVTPEYCFKRPAWFVPNEAAAYEVWQNRNSRSWLFREFRSNELFFYACQL